MRTTTVIAAAAIAITATACGGGETSNGLQDTREATAATADIPATDEERDDAFLTEYAAMQPDMSKAREYRREAGTATYGIDGVALTANAATRTHERIKDDLIASQIPADPDLRSARSMLQGAHSEMERAWTAVRNAAERGDVDAIDRHLERVDDAADTTAEAVRMISPYL